MTRVLRSAAQPASRDPDAVSATAAVGDDSKLPPLGSIIDGRYRLLREIGRGGMGVVYEAAHCVTGVHSALKVLRPEVCEAADGPRRFVREVKVGGRLKHRNIVSAYDAGMDGAWLFMVMELLRGESLDALLERAGPLSCQAAAQLMLPCMRGVARAHAAGIIHRDLKPANIFLCTPEDGEHELQPKVLDFGILCDIGFDMNSWITTRGVPLGTPPYMSVEQLRGDPATPQFDVHAFGVMLYQLVSGELPFAADNLPDLILRINTRVPKPLESFVPGVDPRLSELVQRAISRDPRARFESLHEMILALAAVVHRPYVAPVSEPEANAPALPGHAARPSGRIAGVLGALAAFAAAGSLLAYGLSPDSELKPSARPASPSTAASTLAPAARPTPRAPSALGDPRVTALRASQAVDQPPPTAAAASGPDAARSQPEPALGQRQTAPADAQPTAAAAGAADLHAPAEAHALDLTRTSAGVPEPNPSAGPAKAKARRSAPVAHQRTPAGSSDVTRRRAGGAPHPTPSPAAPKPAAQRDRNLSPRITARDFLVK